MRTHAGVAVLCLLFLAAGAASADQAAAFFDDSEVREVRLTFADPSWYSVLYQAHASDPDDPYFEATFEYGGTVIGPIGARFKGNSSFWRNGVKKSFKLDFNEFSDDLTFVGLKKLNLNNLDLQPDFMREKLFLDFAGRFIPAMRAVHVNVVVNDELWGLYLAVEQPDKTMMESRFGDDEDGNLFEAADSNADLTYLGSDPSLYYDLYELKTNETTNDYSDLVEFLDVLNNTATAGLPAAIEPICDVQNMLAGLALNVLFTNLDSYLGTASEYYLYDRDDTGRFVHIHWDCNETFGTTGDGSPSIANPMTLDPFYLPSGGGPPSGAGTLQPPPPAGGERPLAENLWAVDAYRLVYLQQLARMLREGFDVDAMHARILELADLIRPHVAADPHKAFTLAQFETSLTSSIRSGQLTIWGLEQFVSGRSAYLIPLLATYGLPSDLRLNELMADNDSAVADPDEPGAFEDWFEVTNLGDTEVDMGGLYLTDDLADPTKWQVPAGVSVPAHGHLVLWADEDTDQGPTHAGFKLSVAGEAIGLFAADGVTVVDSVVFGAQTTDVSIGRYPDGTGDWTVMVPPTPGAANQATAWAPTSVAWVPVATHVEGVSGSQWRTDLGLLNPTDAATNLELVFHSQDGATTATAIVGPMSQALLVDVVAQLPAAGTGALEVRADHALRVTSRTYNQVDAAAGCFPSGTMGQSYPGLATTDGLVAGETAWLPQLSENQQYRTNIGLTNTGSQPANVTVTLHDGAGAVLETLPVELPASTLWQSNRPLAAYAGQVDLGRAYAEVSVTSGEGVVAYASVVDNLTNDPSAVSMQRSVLPAAGAVVAVGQAALRLNELMADNDSAVADPDEPGAFEDWVEVYNPGDQAVDMGGMYLTDHLDEPTAWQVPAGVTIEAGGHLLLWADDEVDQGPLHMGFKLSADGEEVGLYLPDGATAVDSVTFPAQSTDWSYGRLPDGEGGWVTSSPATAGATNRLSRWVPVAAHGAGDYGSQWRTDLGVLNPGQSAATVELIFHAAAGSSSLVTAVPAGSQAILVDVVDQLGADGSAALEVRSERPVVVSSRTSTLLPFSDPCAPGGTLGQDLPAFSPGESLAEGEAVWLPQLTENAAYRTNIGLANLSPGPAGVTLTLYDGTGAEVASMPLELAAGTWTQENRPYFAHGGLADLDSGYARVTVTSGAGVIAYASVVDNTTNDPTTVLPLP